MSARVIGGWLGELSTIFDYLGGKKHDQKNSAEPDADPTRLFPSLRMHRDWRDHLWTSLKAVSSGLDESTREQRRILFGSNSIDIEGKSVLTILLDEVSFSSPSSSTPEHLDLTSFFPSHRSFTPSTFFRLPPSFSGLWTSESSPEDVVE